MALRKVGGDGLIVVAAVLALAGGVTFYLRQAVVSERSFANRAVETLERPAVRSAITTVLLDQVVESEAQVPPQLRAQVQAAVDGVVGSPSFQRIFRRAALHAGRLLFSRKSDSLVVRVGGIAGLLRRVLAPIDPGLARKIPADATARLVALREHGFARSTLRAADAVRVLGIVLPILSLAIFAVALACSRELMLTLMRIGFALSLMGACLVVALLVARPLTGQSVRVGALDRSASRAVGDAVWDSYMDDLLRWGLVALGVGVALAGASALLRRRRPPTARPHRSRTLPAICVLLGVACAVTTAPASSSLIGTAGVSSDRRSGGDTIRAAGAPVTKDPALGSGVIVGSAPAEGRAHDGELPIVDSAPAAISALARRYQPTLLVSVDDRNWPVSVGAVLAERGPHGQPVCLVQQRVPRRVCPPRASSLGGAGASASDYLQLPVALSSNRSPNGQFQAFLLGQGISPGPRRRWLADPGLLDPWRTAQIYFYYAGPISASKWPKQVRDPNVPSGLIGLEYWFYYPYNYYPLLVSSRPVAGDRANIDLHQGDWEHVDVLLNPHTLKPSWLYMARHGHEGQFIRWSNPSLSFEEGHPVLQAAYGGHPTYLPGCGARRRAVSDGLLSDFLSCGYGRFGFSASTTPLVDIARTPWSCWPGHFGEASTKLEIQAAEQPENVIDGAKHEVFVAGPRSPLRQAENTGVCKGDPRAPELAAAAASSGRPSPRQASRLSPPSR